ncbi:RagB/SusD family nutrient uptake outer membrane protein [uncultured Hymenobacter sp.]|uniref:RagB/SusD family nutrient uptake outer membrane protein n=1 Tax=uncultured Hymenobacter sp. TaxID=170016 RepID=UPI0035CBC9FD
MHTPLKLPGLLLSALLLATGCQLDRLTDPNNPTLESAADNPTKAKLDQVAAGTFASIRTDVDGIVWYYLTTGIIGREIYVLSPDPTYLVPLGVGEFNNNNYLSERYFNTYSSARRTARLLAQGAQNSQFITEPQRQGYLALANTAEAYAMLVLSDMLYENGLRVDVSDPLKPGKIQPYPVVLAEIRKRLDAGATQLSQAGATLPFALPPGYTEKGGAGLDFTTPAGFLKFNRALTARLAVRAATRPGGSYQDALTAVQASFADPAAPMTAGPRFDFGVSSPDIANPLFQAPGVNGSGGTVAHPSFLRDIRPGDTRASKVVKRAPGAASGLSSDAEPVLYATPGSSIPIIKNEELLLIAAEANLRLGNRAAAISAIDAVAQAYGLRYAPAASALDDDILNEILYQRRYSLYFEGQRWVDLRRLGKFDLLNEPGTSTPEKLSDGTQTTVIKQLPTPFSEIAWDRANP